MSSSIVDINAKLLIVDDEPHILHALVKSLNMRGYQVTGATSGEEALKFLQAENFSLMVLDISMPGIGGITTMQQARDIQPNLLIIVLTGYANVESAIAAVKNHAVDYLRKPVKTQLLSDTIHKILSENAEKLRKETIADAVVNLVTGHTLTSLETQSSNQLHVPPITLNIIQRQITIDGYLDPISLSAGEVKILAYLMAHPNTVISNKSIAESMAETSFDEIDARKIVRPYISRLRRKVPYLNEKPRILDTVRGAGYIFRVKN